MIRIVLDNQRFAELVAGKVVRVMDPGAPETVEIILSDIGWQAMVKAIERAINDENRTRKP